MATAHNLPAGLTSFIGRESELVEIQFLLSSTRLLTLTGVGGIGKTRLALEAAHRSLERFQDGIWLVDLVPLGDASLVASVIARAVGLQDDNYTPLLARLRERLQHQSVLLVLDNCEHLVQSCAELAERLLQGCPRLRVLATSREALHIPGEVIWLVPPLSLPEKASGAVEEALQSEGVRLFSARAQAVSLRLALDDESVGAIVGICRRLDGVPLAIELAAARIRLLSPSEIAARLGDRFQLLSAGSRTSDPRHQTLMALVTWSYDLLSTSEQLLFQRLAVFVGGWTLGAAEAICSREGIAREEILTLVSQLVDKSLVEVSRDGPGTRYRLLETLRQYAAARLRESGELLAFRTRHVAWFRELAEQLRSDLEGPRQSKTFARLEGELGNIRAGLEWSNAEPSALEEGLRLAGALMRFWYYRGYATEGSGWLSSLLRQSRADRRSESQVTKAARASALMAAGFLSALQREVEVARPLAEEALALHRELGDRRGIAFSLWELGQGARIEGDLERARLSLEESLAVSRELESPPLLSAALRELGQVARARLDYDQAAVCLQESLTVAREHGDLRRVALALTLLAALSLEQGFLAGAQALLRECLGVSQSAGVKVGFAPALELLACLAALQSQPARALRLAGASASALRSLGTLESLHVECQAQAEPYLDSARQALGERAAVDACAEGAALSLEDAIVYALADAEPVSDRGPQAATGSAILTTRELELAALLARGLTNREIAAALVISSGTVKRHVENILAKLGLPSRRELKQWQAGQAPVGADFGRNVVPFRPLHDSVRAKTPADASISPSG